jgi:EpsD family peptidyl-prolyl cis-trans isomerase
MEEGQVLARVNGDEVSVHQLNFALTQGPGRSPAAADQGALLDKMIDRQLALQQALDKKLDRRPDVMMRLEEARRDILAAAYVAELSAGMPGPTDVEVASYYRDHPGLFSERKLFRLREIAVTGDAPALTELQRRLEQNQDLALVLAWLRQQPRAFTDQMVMRPAEQLPIEVADRLHKVRPGEVISLRLPRALVVYQMQSAELAPLAWAAAAPMIREHLRKQQDAERLDQALIQLRQQAKIERKAGQP